MDAEAYHVSAEFIGYCTATFNKSDKIQGYSSHFQENSMLDEGSCSEAEPFALQVHGDSMEPEFKHGCIIVVDPAGVLKNECFVVAKNLVFGGDNLGEPCPAIGARDHALARRAGPQSEYDKEKDTPHDVPCLHDG